MKRTATALFLILTAAYLHAADSVLLDIKYMSPDTGEKRTRLESVLTRAATGASRRYGEYINAYVNGDFRGRADYTLSVTAVLEGDSPVLSLEFSGKGLQSALSQAMLGGLSETTHLYLSDLIFKLWTLANPDAIVSGGNQPRILEDIPAQYILDSVLPDFTGYSTVSAAAVRENGNVVLAMGSLCYEVNSLFSVLSPVGEDQFTSTGSTFLMGASLTPGGTLFLKPANGREIYKVMEGVPRTQKIRTGIDVNGPMAILSGGVVLLYDTSGKKFIRIEGNRRTELTLDLNQYSYIYSMATGPEGNLWLYDNMEQRFKIFADDGTFINSVIPVGQGTDQLFPMSMAVADDGSILVFSNNSTLYKFGSDGILQWKMKEYPYREMDVFPMTPIGLALDEENGLIYMTDYAAKRVMQFYDSDLDRGEPNGDALALLKLNGELFASPDSPDVVRKKARFYMDKSAWVPARMWLEELVNLDPFDREALAALDGITVNSLLKMAGSLETQTLDTARNVGPESARTLFSRTVSLYEKILSISPGDRETTARLSRFREAYNREAAVPDSGSAPLTIASLSVEGIFPSLLNYYRNHPVGTVLVKNSLSVPVSNVRAVLELGRFTDFPLESDNLEKLGPGEEKVLDLKVILNDKALELSEDLPLPLQVRISWDEGGARRTVSKTGSATMYRRTALTWDNTAKLASFIMPNETIVSAFSHRVLNGIENMEGLPARMNRAARICDALGVYGINYIEDPDTPLSQIMDSELLIDTVRYPRTTLYIRSGDCDDSTALLASLLESSGISTAIMTSPGHVFLAFDTEEPASNRWLFDGAEQKTIINGGTVWIPLESTNLRKGFGESWKSASRIMGRTAESDVEFLPLASLRKEFPPLPLGDSNIQVVEPSGAEISALNGTTLNNLKIALYSENVKKYEREMAGTSGTAKRRSENRLAALHARFGEYGEAEKLFRGLIRDDPSYLSPYLNLGNIYYLQEDFSAAIAILTSALELKSDSVMLNLALARTYNRLGDKSNRDRYFTLVKNQSADLSEQYAYLDGGTAGRAGADEEPPAGWSGE